MNLLSALADLLPTRQVFASYHHDLDSVYYLVFSVLARSHQVLHDHSLGRLVQSTSRDYLMRVIRGDYIKGSSCTFVLCGSETPARKYVDWEISSTLDKQHGLIGLILPTVQKDCWGRSIVPQRLYDNYMTGYAIAAPWDSFLRATPGEIKFLIEIAVNRPNSLIDNRRILKTQNGWNRW